MINTGTKQLLDEAADMYNRPEFILSDPISVPHRFQRREDIEIAGFLATKNNHLEEQ
jgi:hypothetical protein